MIPGELEEDIEHDLEEEEIEAVVFPPPPVSALQMRALVNDLTMKISRGVEARDYDSFFDAEMASAQALGGHRPHHEQSVLAHAARSYEGPQQEFIREQAARLLLLTNFGFIRSLIRKHAPGYGIDNEDGMAAGMRAIVRALRVWRPEDGLFLSALQWSIRNEITKLGSEMENMPVRMKSLAPLMRNMQQLLKDADSRGVALSAQDIAVHCNAKLKDVWTVLPWLQSKTFSLQGEWVSQRADAGEPGIPEIVRAPELQAPSIEEAAVADELRAQVADALADLEDWQVDLVTGEVSMSELQDSWVAEGRARNRKQAMYLIQTEMGRVHKDLRAALAVHSEEVRYAGPNAIENSVSSADSVREALLALTRANDGALTVPGLGQFSYAQVLRFKRGRSTADGSVNVKANLRLVAEACQLVHEDGSLNVTVLERVLERNQDISPKQGILGQVVASGITELVAADRRGLEVKASLRGGKVWVDQQAFDTLEEAARSLGAAHPDTFWKVDRQGTLVPLKEAATLTAGGVTIGQAKKVPTPSVADLFDRGMIPGGKLVGAYKGVACEALYDRASGTFVVFSEGKKVGEATTPSVASKLVSKEENGYAFWSVPGGKKPVKLKELRKQCVQLMLEEEAAPAAAKPELSAVDAPAVGGAGEIDLSL